MCERQRGKKITARQFYLICRAKATCGKEASPADLIFGYFVSRQSNSRRGK